MLTRLKRKTVEVYSEKPYYEKFFILSNDVLYFRTFLDYIKFYKVAHSTFKKVYLPEELREYFLKILSIISSCESLYIEGFNNETESIDMEKYLRKIQKVLDNVDNPYYLEAEYVSVFEMKPIAIEELDQYQGKFNMNYPTEVLFLSQKNANTTYLQIVVPQDLHDKYSGYVVGIQEKITGDFYTDLFLDLIDEMVQVKLSRTCANYNCPLITEQGVHESVAIAINYAAQTLSYLKNCTSFKTGKLEIYDELEISNRINMILTFLKRAVSIRV